MSKFCQNCGSALPEGTKFCQNCGTAVPDTAGQNTTQYAAQPAQVYTEQFYQQVQYQPPVYAGNGAVRQGVPAPGFSDRVNHPEIISAVKKNRRAAGIFAFFLVPLPLIGFAAYSMFTTEMELDQALTFGGIVSAIFLVFALYGFIKGRASKTYEATVIDKKSRRAHRHNSSGDNNDYTEYITVVRTAAGGKKNIVEHEGSQIWAWNYLNIGDRFKYHPQFHFPYELYDKSKAPYIACVSCPAQNPVEADRCQKCGLPLLK